MLIRSNVNLKELTNYRIGGPAQYFCEVSGVGEIKEALKFSRDNKAPFFILGGGTNLLIKDEGFPGLIIKPVISSVDMLGSVVRAGAGINMGELIDILSDSCLSGLEWAGGLPGTLGGAIRGNAGAFGGEIKDIVSEVVSFDTVSGKVLTRDNAGCEFSYRNSIFKKLGGREIIMEAALSLRKGDADRIRSAVEEKINYRKARHPLEYPSAGSVFKNVDTRLVPQEILNRSGLVIKTDPFPIIPAAFLIAESGLKGTSVGGAMISTKHSNFIVNVDQAKAKDVRDLIEIVKKGVRAEFGITLEEEILIL